MRSSFCSAICFAVLAGAGAEPAPEAAAPVSGPREVFPGVRVDREKKMVEFDGTIPINAHTEPELKVFLEATVCSWDSKEHESLVVTKAKPSQVHAALLLVGLKPGRPGFWRLEEKTWVGVPPEGDEVSVKFVMTNADGAEREEDAAEWIVNSKDGRSLRQSDADAKWLFAGSRLVAGKVTPRGPGEAITPEGKGQPAEQPGSPEVYVADVDGTLVGLTTFGAETISLNRMYNPDSDKEAPEWVASRQKTPPMGTKVVVRVKAK